MTTSPTLPSTLPSRADAGISALTPGYFALVMATGIVSIAMRTNEWFTVSVALLIIAAISYVVLVVLNIIRVIRHPEQMADDFADPGRAFGFFTFVAATDVLGSRLSQETGFHGIAVSLLLVASIAWIILGYTVPWTAILGKRKKVPISTANGTWFIWAVASQSIAVLAATLEVEFDAWRPGLALLAVFSWSVGIFLYCAVGVFVAVRMLTVPFRPEDLTPPYWVAMGATAITVVAGARIVMMANAPMVDATRGLIAGASVFFWAFGTWLIPPLVMAGWWRHVRHRIPFRYEATLWSIIFPLGMYGVGSQFLGTVDSLPIMHAIGYVESWVALAAWVGTFVWMLVNLWRTVLRPPRSAVVS
ncbi:tellurite resistance/C4-dicarboxylate transporter family protein [Microbacterium horticulturae]|uniref:Tellurite resistance/C4-dicarboxylate transporter family protein n=1 Tax=Microbacterium horticulturae TaxID=3028316 RepID=A0ABY8C0J0_9MICO|nr:tellurite resistance/C4-dicarboxylate transporter family protein [Microbacterium sp. KACC 23027]WEG09970.1 tellurite resistance/C4-dicarboxylate transporter family protein [Microbacterium sp. KACC 23027]